MSAAAARLASLLTMLLVCGGLLLLPAAWLNAPASYLSRHTGYTFLWQVQELHSYDAVDHGRDYNSLRVYRIGADAAGFAAYVQEAPDWHPLPLPEELTALSLLDLDFDAYILPMLRAENGAFRIDYFAEDSSCGVILYDTDTQCIYVRTTSFAFSPLPANWIKEEEP